MTGDAASRLHAVVLAGGSGARFWPLSRELNPKQLLSVFGGESLITRSVLRVKEFCRPQDVHVITGERLADEIRNHLTAQPSLAGVRIDYVVEPGARNTAPAIALAAALVAREDPDALVIVLPSDHLLADGDLWRRTVGVAMHLAEEGFLATIGLVPTRPETGYGYIQAGDEIPGAASGDIAGCLVERFVEKPDTETAARFVSGGDHLWNSGMLVARASVVLRELRAAGERGATADSSAGGEIADVAEWLTSLPREEWLAAEALERYGALPAVPFDRAVLEVSDAVAVVPTSLDWSDVGSLLSIAELTPADERGNVLVGRAVDVGSEGIVAYSADRLVATLGLRDMLVIDTADATLVAPKDRAQDVRLVVDALKATGAPEVVASRQSLRPWGSWTLLMTAPGFQIKSIDVSPGSRLSLQSHARRSEHWIVIEGRALIELDGREIECAANESCYIPIGARHRLANPGPEPLKVIEVAVGEYLGEDDIVRYDDDWGR